MQTTIKTKTYDVKIKPAYDSMVNFQIGDTSVNLTQDQIGALIVGLEQAAKKAVTA